MCSMESFDHNISLEGNQVSRDGAIKRVRIVFRGVVQGVGFRPAVYRCAVGCGLAGFVQNRRSEVVAEIQGTGSAVERFDAMMAKNLPAPAHVESKDVEEIDAVEGAGFQILESSGSDYVLPPIPPDLALCATCRSELLDPKNCRYLYPFITCTECGPRFSIVEDTPFDRERTSMIDFMQCERCKTEYRDPADRRFHSQTNSCPACGPTLRLVTPTGRAVAGDPVIAAINALANGKVVALQGIGGFHLAADPRFPAAVARLRRKKVRERKPFALMVGDLNEAEALCLVSEEARVLLESTACPIVILPARSRRPQHLGTVSDLRTLGIMLPYTPLHYLLFFHPQLHIPYRHLVMTSGNRGNEPIITDPARARRELADTADLFLYHDRRILIAAEDSVVRPIDPIARQRDPGVPTNDSTKPLNRPAESAAFFFIRRSRGYVPGALHLPVTVTMSTLAAGGDLKSAPALAMENVVLLSPYLGDLEGPAARAAYTRTVERMLSLYDASPERIVSDLHPRYFSTVWAADSSIPHKVSIQHHYAHQLSVMAEHGLVESIGAAFDGTGYGSDGTIWGGEFLHATRTGFTRLGSFRPFALPGGDQAIRNPARIAFSILHGYHHGAERRAAALLGEAEAAVLPEMLDRSINSPPTSSAGRLFDAAAALLGLVREVSYEGEGPMKLEGLAAEARGRDGARRGPNGSADLLPLVTPAGPHRATDAVDPSSPQIAAGFPSLFLFDPRPLLAHIALASESQDPASLALLFHETIADAIVRGALIMRNQTGINTFTLSGGVFQNALIRELLSPALAREKFDVCWNRVVPPGDGGIAVGQAWYEGGGELPGRASRGQAGDTGGQTVIP